MKLNYFYHRDSDLVSQKEGFKEDYLEIVNTLENITDKNIAFTVQALILGKDTVGDKFNNIDAIQAVFGLTKKQAKLSLELANSYIGLDDKGKQR